MWGLWYDHFEETPISFILTFVGASIRDIRNFRRWTGCRDHNLFAPGRVGRHTFFFWAKIDIPQFLTYFWGLLQLAKRLCPFKLYQNSVQGGMVDAKSYLTNAKTHHDEASQVTDLSPDLTTCDTERRSLAHPSSGSRPQEWNNRVRPSPALRQLWTFSGATWQTL